MEQFLWNVDDVFLVADRGVMISADIRGCDHCPDAGIGEILQIRRPDGSRSTFENYSIGHVDPPNSERPRHFFLSGVLDKEMVPIGSEVWLLPADGPSDENAVRPTPHVR